MPAKHKPLMSKAKGHEHKRHFDMLNRMYQCNVCGKYFPSFRGFRVHSRAHVTYCQQCSMEFQNNAMYRRHLKFHNENICYNCNKGFASDLARISHQSLHDTCTNLDSKFTCCFCGKGCSSRLVLLRHCRSVHKKNALVFFCGECVDGKDCSFPDKTELFKHLKEFHQSLGVQQMDKEVKDEDSKSLSLYREDDIPAEFLNYDLLMVEDYSIRMVEEFLDDALLASDSEHQSSIDLNKVPVDDMQFGHEEIVDNKDIKKSDTTFELSEYRNEHDLLQFRYKCPKCVQMFTQQIDLNLHLAHEHDEMVLVCNECGASFRKMSELELHRNEHKQENRIANESLSSFFRASRQHPNDKGEDQHWLAIVTDDDSGNFKYMCKLCKKTYHRKFCIEQHNCPKNTSPNHKYHCAECNMSFAILPEMLTHRKTHIADTLYCSLCDKKFTTIEGLKYHLKTHTGVKAFKCSYCHKKFTANVNLNAHLRTVHSEVKPHKCNLCILSFATADHLKKHVSSIHLGIRNHVCASCDKQFLQQSHLTQHMWIHTGIKPNPCEFCSNSYTSKVALRKHVTKVHDATL